MNIYKFNSIFHQVDISLLRHFFAVATFGGFSKASRATGVSQPALSLGLQKLEKSLGVVLIDRAKRPFELTHEGRALFALSQQFQGSFERVVGEWGGRRIEVQKRWKLGAALSISFEPWLALCQKMVNLKEKIDLELWTLNSYQLLNDVFEGKLDAALVPDDIYDQRLKFIPFLKDQLIFVIGKQQKKRFFSGELKSTRIFDFPLITFPRDTPMRTLTDKLCITENLEFKTIYSINNIEGLKALVKQSIGGAFVMRSLVMGDLREKSLFEAVLPIQLPKLGISYVSRPGEEDSSNAKIIYRLLQGSLC